jgi:hypothetical protein
MEQSMRAAHAFFLSFTVLVLSVSLPVLPAEAKPHAKSHKYSKSHKQAGGRPARWCGWWMRTQKGGGPEYNLARNWKHWGRPSKPRVGAVVVWPHHVGMITGRTASGEWIVRSGNDGGRVRERPRSVAGAVFRVG